MKYLYILFILSLFSFETQAQTAKDYCVRLGATIQESPPQITLHWPVDTATGKYKIYRKAKNATYWGAIYDTLPGTATQFVDTAVKTDTAYEYRVNWTGLVKTTNISADGYIYAGIKLPVVEYRGKLLMIVDSLLNDSLSTELYRLQQDIAHDGWAIQRFDIAKTLPDSSVKAMIKTAYLNDTANVKAVLIVGHIAVPYSGDINPDGHPQHLGAWPADIYYATLNFNYSDSTVKDTSGSYPANRNVAHDGKWDQSTVYGTNPVMLQISRIDLANMPVFAHSERQLLKSYLDKDHAYRTKAITVQPRGLIDDNFGAFSGEAFALSGWRNFAPILGDSTTKESDYISTLDTANYQWSYGCGGGSFTSAGGIGSTTNFTTKHIKSIFSMLFGSYFGDWNVANNFLRAPMCALEPALTVCWAGRPHWVFHHMAMGENIGYSAKLTQNNPGYEYSLNYGINFVHVALMGDLTLRQHVIAPPLALTIKDTAQTALLTWTASTDNVLGYYVYRSNTEFGKYDRVSPALITGNSFRDLTVDSGLHYYVVRAMRLETSASGSYYNLSEGVADTVTVHDTVVIHHGPKAMPDVATTYANRPITITVTSNDVDSSSLPLSITSVTTPLHGTAELQRGDTSIAYTPDNAYTGIDSFRYTVCDSNHCDSTLVTVNILADTTTGIATLTGATDFELYPNPASTTLEIAITSGNSDRITMEIFDVMGIRFLAQVFSSAQVKTSIDVSHYPQGIYLCRISSNSGTLVKRFEVVR